jgi:hypothetical protein
VKTGGKATENNSLGIFLITVAVIVVICTILQTVYTIKAKEEVSKINYKMGLPLTLAFGVHNGADAFVRSVDAEPGQEIPAEMIFYNISGAILDIAAHVSLPETLEFVPGSAKLFNSSYPDGKDIEADLSVGWENLGSYNLYNAETGHGSGVVLFKVKVSENKNLFKPGVGALNMAAEIGGYMGGSAVTDTIYCYASVLVSQ